MYEWPVKVTTQDELLEEFVVLTKNIDVAAVVQANRDKKEYFVFFGIGTHLAKEAKKSIVEMTDETFNFILSKYYEQGRIWAKQISVNRIEENPESKKVIFNEWHKLKAKEHLFNKLKEYYPEWTSTISLSTAE
jgi:hypothetical protein